MTASVVGYMMRTALHNNRNLQDRRKDAAVTRFTPSFFIHTHSSFNPGHCRGAAEQGTHQPEAAPSLCWQLSTTSVEEGFWPRRLCSPQLCQGGVNLQNLSTLSRTPRPAEPQTAAPTRIGPGEQNFSPVGWRLCSSRTSGRGGRTAAIFEIETVRSVISSLQLRTLFEVLVLIRCCVPSSTDPAPQNTLRTFDFSDFLAEIMPNYGCDLIVGDFSIHACGPDEPMRTF